MLFGRDVLDAATANDGDADADRMSSSSDVAADLDEFSEQLLQQGSSKHARIQGENADGSNNNNGGRRRPLPLRLLAMANNALTDAEADGMSQSYGSGNGSDSASSFDFSLNGDTQSMRLGGEDDESMPFNDDLRDIRALESYEKTLSRGARSPVETAPHAQTSFILGVSGPVLRGEEQEALLKHFSPLSDALSTMQGLTNLDRLPLPRGSEDANSDTGPLLPRRNASPPPPSQLGPHAARSNAYHTFPYRRQVSTSAPAALNRVNWTTLLQDDAQDEINDVFG